MTIPVGPPTPSPTRGPGPRPGAQRLPAPRRSRRHTQVRRNAVVLAWVVAAAVLAVLVIGGPLAAWGQWLPLHTLLLGGIGSAITVWSAHFADTLLHRPALGGAALVDLRLAVHSLGAVVVLVGVTGSYSVIAMTGAVLVIVAALAGVVAIGVQYRRAIAPRLAALAIHYAVALFLLALGAFLGYLVSWSQDHGRAATADALYVAHTLTMVLGFVGITVLGTLTVLWPTMLRTKMEPEASRWTTRALPVLVAGTAVAACAGLWPPLVALGCLTYVLGAGGVVVPALRTARRVPPHSFATATAGAAVLWFLSCIVWLGLAAAGGHDAGAVRDVIHSLRVPLATGFALQILAAALSYLTPVMLGGGPATTRATNTIMEKAAAYRVVAVNTCLLLAVLVPLPWPVRATAAVTAGLVSSYVLVGIGLSLRLLVHRLRSRNEAADDAATRVRPPAVATTPSKESTDE